MSMDRRVQTRAPIEGDYGTGSLVGRTRRVPVLLLDETVHGIGVVAVRPGGIEVGGEVTFESTVRHVEGRVGVLRHVTEHDQDIFRIGIEWTD